MSLSLLGLLLLSLVVLGVVVGLLVLLANSKARAATLVALLAIGLIVVLLTASAFMFRRSEVVSRPAAVHLAASQDQNGNPDILGVEPYRTLMQSTEARVSKKASDVPAASPTSAAKTSADAAEKGEDEVSKAIATRTVGMLRAMIRALGRALVEEEQNLAVQKSTAKPLPSPASGRGAGGEGGRATDNKALTLTLSQRERGLSQALSQGERGLQARPPWVGAPSQLIGDSYQMSVSVGPFTTRAECDANLPEALQDALEHYVEVCLGDQAIAPITLPANDLQQLVKSQWEETRQSSVGPMIQLHVLLQFDRKVKDRVLEEHRQAIITRRLQLVASWAAMGLSMLTVLFGYLKIDLATDGVYRGRLRLVAAAALVALTAIAVVAVG